MENTPPSRFPVAPIEQAQGRWWLAKVKPRQEKQLAFDFVDFKVEYYLPLYKKVTFRPGTNKKRISVVPLFPGYICFAQDIPKDIFRTGRVVDIIEIKNQSRFVQEISSIYAAIENGYVVQPFTGTVELKTPVEIISGSLKGIKGIVSTIKDQSTVVLEVGGLGAASVVIDISQLKILQ